jgi:hypothetical protein
MCAVGDCNVPFGAEALALFLSLMRNVRVLGGSMTVARQAGILHFFAKILNKEKYLHLCKIKNRFDLANTKTDPPHSVTFQSAQPIVRRLSQSLTGQASPSISVVGDS